MLAAPSASLLPCTWPGPPWCYAAGGTGGLGVRVFFCAGENSSGLTVAPGSGHGSSRWLDARHQGGDSRQCAANALRPVPCRKPSARDRCRGYCQPRSNASWPRSGSDLAGTASIVVRVSWPAAARTCSAPFFLSTWKRSGGVQREHADPGPAAAVRFRARRHGPRVAVDRKVPLAQLVWWTVVIDKETDQGTSTRPARMVCQPA
jgi:hypothetical protein